MRSMLRSFALSVLVLSLGVLPARAQAPTLITSTTPASNLVVIPISKTAAVNTIVTLTIPAPPGGLSNYICYLAFDIGNDGTSSSVMTNLVTVNTNFNSFNAKVSAPATAGYDSGIQVLIPAMSPTTGCVKSTVPGTATAFVSPTPGTHQMWNWIATYFQAP